METRLRTALLGMIRAYQRTLSWLLPASCRFYPSCSEYAAQALQQHGSARGLWLTLRRLSRCRPGGGSGYDPVPDRGPPRAATGRPPRSP